VVQAVTFKILEGTVTPHFPVIGIGGPGLQESAQHPIPVQSTTFTFGSFTNVVTAGTLVIPLIVDYTGVLAMSDLSNATGPGEWFVSGYMLPLTPGATCSNP
jgi:hypothetical protein